MMYSIQRALCAFAVLAVTFVLASTVQAAPINLVSYGSLTVGGLEDFESVAAAPFPGVEIDTILDLDGSSYAERFAGQTLGATGLFDTLSGTPSGPLALVAGVATENLVVATVVNVGIAGLGNAGYPLDSANGEGAFSILFDIDTPEFGIEILGAHSGSAILDFFQRDGSLIESVVLASVVNGLYGFARDGGVVDIAGVSITNQDDGGFGFDNVRFRVTQIPEPGTALLVGFGLLGLGLRRGR